MIDNADEKRARIGMPSTISQRAFNVIMGLTLIWGFVVDVALCIFAAPALMQLNPWILLIGYFVVSIGAIFIIYKSDNPAVSFLGFTLLAAAMGCLLATYVPMFTDQQILDAIVLAGIVTAVMVLASIMFPQVFMKMGRALLFALIAVIVVELIAIIFTGTSNIIIDFVVAGIFCLYIGYDFAKSQAYGRTVDNAIDSAADIYVDIINLFVRILSIMGRSKK